MKKTLKSGRNVEIKQMDIDDVDYCDDLQRISQEKDGNIAIYGINRSNTAWIRKGLIGGDAGVFVTLPFQGVDDGTNEAIEVKIANATDRAW